MAHPLAGKFRFEPSPSFRAEAAFGVKLSQAPSEPTLRFHKRGQNQLRYHVCKCDPGFQAHCKHLLPLKPT